MPRPEIKDIENWKREAKILSLYKMSGDQSVPARMLERGPVNGYERFKQARFYVSSEMLISVLPVAYQKLLYPVMAELRDAQMRVDQLSIENAIKALGIQTQVEESKKKGGFLGLFGGGK